MAREIKDEEYESFVMTTLRLPPDLLNLAKTVCKRNDTTVAQTMRRALRREIREMEKREAEESNNNKGEIP